MIRKISIETLEDRILGAWTGKSYGAMMGEPMEFHAQGEIYEGGLDIHPEAPKTWLHHEDDLYVNMAFLEIVRDKGLDASADDFAKVFRQSKFMLWHANGQARQNIREGISPLLSGHPFYNPHADDIDFQIECDFIGLVCPGLSGQAAALSDRVGHLMNYGEGYYAGLFLAALYTQAFFETDPVTLVKNSLKSIPEKSAYAEIIRDLLDWHRESPDDWRSCWARLETKWNRDLCPWAKTDKGRFNIQGAFNGAYVIVGLLFGHGDYMESIRICTRCGQDTDSNVGSCGGVMGALLGFKALPQEVHSELAPYMDRDYAFTSLSINSATALCSRLAMENILRNGGKNESGLLTLQTQALEFAGTLETSFRNFEISGFVRAWDEGPQWQGQWERTRGGDQEWAEKMHASSTTGDQVDWEFSGTCVYVQGNLDSNCGIAEIYIDGVLKQERDLYIVKTWDNCYQSTCAWITGLSDGPHRVSVKVSGRRNSNSAGSKIELGRFVAYRGTVAPLPQGLAQ